MSITIRQVTDGRGRRYVIEENGEPVTVPSVTTILGAMPKNGLDWWGFKLGLQAAQELSGRYNGVLPESIDALYEAAKQTDYVPHRALKAAGARGTDVHHVAEMLLRTGSLAGLPEGTAADEGYIDALVTWHDDYSVSEWEVVEVEALLFSATHRYAGQCDLIAKRSDGMYLVVDYKTSKAIHDSHLIQTAAYEHAAREMGLIPEGAPAEGHVVRLGVDGKYEVRKSLHTIEDFLAVKALHAVVNDKAKAKGVKP